MATNKTLNPTNTTIAIPAMTDKPDASIFSNCIDKIVDAVNAIHNKFTWRSETPSTFDSTKLTDVVAMRRGYTVLVRVTFKAGLFTDWHNDIVTGLSNVYTPPTAVYGVMRVNSAADINKRAIAVMNTNGNVQFLPGETFNADIPFEFVFPTANNN